MKSSGINSAQARKAAHAILAFEEKKANTDLLQSITEHHAVYLQITAKKVLQAKKTIKIDLPHALNTDQRDICLFVKDVTSKDSREHEKSLKHFTKLLKTKGVQGIDQVIPLKQLKLEYQPYEAKRALSSNYSLFLADERVTRLLPRLLGKSFYGRKKIPVSVNLSAKDLGAEILRAVNGTRLHMSGKGSASLVAVGHTGMSGQELAENVVAVYSRLCEAFPGGPGNIRFINLKTETSPSLPLLYNAETANAVKLPVKEERLLLAEPEDVDTVHGAKVAVTSKGEIMFFPNNASRDDESIKKRVKKMETRITKQKREKAGVRRPGKRRPRDGSASQKATADGTEAAKKHVKKPRK